MKADGPTRRHRQVPDEAKRNYIHIDIFGAVTPTWENERYGLVATVRIPDYALLYLARPMKTKSALEASQTLEEMIRE
eukprot:2659110-Amphidinium_carterae.1